MNVNLAYGLATTAIALYIAAIVMGNLHASFSASLATNTAATAGLGNVTSYAFMALRIGAIGLLVYAAMNMFGMFGVAGKRSRR